MIYKGGTQYYDTPIGVLSLESYFPKPPGHIRNPRSYPFPIVWQVVKGVDVPRLLFNPTPDLAEPLTEAARQLEKDGVKAIVGSCGFLVLFQKELSQSVRIPVLSSSLLQLPLVRLMHGEQAKIGILTASAKALTPRHFEAIGLDMGAYAIAGMDEAPVFSSIILQQTCPDMDMEAMESEICAAAAALSTGESLDALVLECTDLAPFARAVQRRTELPVYDINSLVEYAAYSVCRRAYPFP